LVVKRRRRLNQTTYMHPKPYLEKRPVSEIINVEVPSVGESITEVQIGQWLKAEGDWIESGEDLVEIETEKASVPIPSPASGFVDKLLLANEDFANVGDVIAVLRPGEKPAGGAAVTSAAVTSAAVTSAAVTSAAVAETQAAASGSAATQQSSAGNGTPAPFTMPAAQRLLDEHGLSAADVPATGPGGRLLKEDVLSYISNHPTPAAVPAPTATPPPEVTTLRRQAPTTLISDSPAHRMEEVKSLSMLRRTIAARLVEAQQSAALLTTFNEIDMAPVMAIRKKYKERFAERHGVKLGFMSFFAKATVEALRRYPAVNAEIRGDKIVYRHYQDIGVAIGGGKGLVVPILRNVELMSFADIESGIADFARQAGENRIQPDDLIGGTFTISNGGIYGSLLSTPIVNPPQSGILGLHSIQDRPMAVEGNVVIRPMMYVALTYDHRIVDGREAVGFLKTIKEVIEDPARLFLEL
jgi:2-oxoglutarate dehydrogenase E2 component (dihydrolipoamide succinyltransferase)